MSLPTGSPFWQVALLFLAAVFLLFETWRGWRAGFIRAGINLGAILISGTFGILAGQAAGILFGGLDSPAGLVAALAVGTGVGLGLFVIVWLLGSILFKRTAHQGSGLIRILWGSGGAVLGLLIGLILLWGGISLVRGLGALAEGTSASQKPPVVAKGLVTLKESLELGHVGEWIQSVDLIPSEAYDLIVQISRVSSDESAMLRFVEYPGVQSLMQNPRIVNLLSDPAVMQAAEKRNFAALLTSKALYEAAQDPELAKQLGAINLRDALNHALPPDSSSPPPPSQQGLE